MKKFFYAILFAVLPVMAVSLASCSDEDDLPDVKFNIGVENASIIDGTIYVVQGDNLNITSVSVTNQEAGKEAGLTNVKFFLDGYYLGTSIFAPYQADNITDAETPVGDYELGISCTVLAVDKSIAFGNVFYPIKVVQSAADIPGGGSNVDARSMSIKN